MGNQIKMVRGHINIIILKSLEEGDKYGYEIGKYIENKTDGGYSLKQATLYSSLNRLEDKEIISSYWGDETDTNGGRRKYYSLTETGKEICRSNIKQWNQHRKFIDAVISDDKDIAHGVQTTPAATTNDRATTTSDRHTEENSQVSRLVAAANGAVLESSAIPATSQFLIQKNTGKDDSGYHSESPKSSDYKNIISKLISGVLDPDGGGASKSLSNDSNIPTQTGAPPSPQQQGKEQSLTDLQKYDNQHDSRREDRHEGQHEGMHDGRRDNMHEGQRESRHEGQQQLYYSAERQGKAADSSYFNGYNSPAQTDGRPHNRLSAKEDTQGYSGDAHNHTGVENSPRDELLESFRQKTGQLASEGLGAGTASYSLLPASSQTSPFERLQDRMNEEGFNVRSHTSTKSQPKQFLLVNKQNFLSMLILYLVMAIQTLGIYIFAGSIIDLPMEYYLYAASICAIFPLAAAVQYYVYPDKRSKRKYYAKEVIISSIMHFLVAVLAISAIALIFDVNVAAEPELVLKLVVPCVYASNFIWHGIIWSAVYNSKRCFT